LRAIQFLHENFARSLASSLSAYLRSYVLVNLVSFEQISYAEFLDGLPSPTVIAGLSLRPFDGYGVIELGSTLFFPVLEMLLGRSGRASKPLEREITEVEEHLLESLLRVILQDLRDAWRSVASMDFSVQNIEKEPQFLQVLAPSEAVVAIGMEVRLSESSGMLNLAIPSLLIKMMRQKFDQQWTTRTQPSSPGELNRMLNLVSDATSEIEVQLQARPMAAVDLARLKAGDVLLLDHGVTEMVSCRVNGLERFRGRMARAGRKRAVVIEQKSAPEEHLEAARNL
jgi:flagellar motor switch protein FliM